MDRLRVGDWVDGPELASAHIGGSEGLKRLRELRNEDGYDIRMRKHPDPTRDIFQYRLVAPINVGMGSGDGEAETIEKRVMFDIAPQDGDTVEVVEVIPAPEPAETYDYKAPPKGTGRVKLGKTLEGKYVTVYDGPPPEPELPIAEGQTDMGVPEAPQFRFTTQPGLLELGTTVPCPRCRGYRRAIRERDPVTNKQLKGGKILGYEELSRDPHKPSDTCPRCNGFGVIPNA